MSSIQDPNRMKGPGNGGGVREPQGPEFDSWRHQQQTHQQQGFNPMSSLASDPYGFYQQSQAFHHYPGFGVGEGTWSNGDHMTFLGGYGGQLGAEQQFSMDTATMFGAGGGFGAFTQPAGYGFDFHAGSAGYSQWGSAAAAAAGRTGEQYYRPEQYHQAQDGRGRVPTAEQSMLGLNLSGAHQIETKEPKQGHEPSEPVNQGGESNGSAGSGGGGQAKKMSWASVASQPAKPAPPAGKSKKPGVLMPPVLPGKPNLDIGTWEASKQNGGPHPLMNIPPPLGPAVGPGGQRGGWAGVAGPRGGRPPTGAPVPVMGNGLNHVTMAGPPPPSHPVLDELKSVNDYNPRDFDLNPRNSRFFVVKSYSEDDIHRSIKYEIWCSTEHGNKRLDSAFREREGKGNVYLFFSVNGSGHFCGMAEMLSGVDYNSSAGVWAQDKWKGQFKVKWIYVKDVPNAQLRHIRLENNENKPVTNSRDTQEVPIDKGKQVLKILHGFKHTTSIFDDFIHYEKRQEEDEGRRQPQQNGDRRSDRRGDREDGRREDGSGRPHRDDGRRERDEGRRDDGRDRRDDHRERREDGRERRDDGREDRGDPKPARKK